MDTYKLTYFNLRGIVEPIRFVFKYANVSFEDNHVEANDWPRIKKDFKWQQLPYLEYNGKVLTQSQAIGRFLARKFNLVPDDSWGQAKSEEVFGAVEDLRLQIKPMIISKFEGNAEREKELREQLLSTVVPMFLKNLNELLEDIRKSNAGTSTDLILGGAKPTWEDFCLAHFTEMWTTVLEKSDLLDAFPLLKKQQKAVYTLPGMTEWIATRPPMFI